MCKKHQLEPTQMKGTVIATENSGMATAKKRIGELEEKVCGRWKNFCCMEA